MDRMELEVKLETLMSLAMDDREGAPGTETMLPPRLRNANAAGALRPLNLRYVRIGPNGPRAKLLRILSDERVQLQLSLLPDASGPRAAAHAAEAAGDGADLSSKQCGAAGRAGCFSRRAFRDAQRR